METHPTKKDNGLLQAVELKSGLYLVATPIGNLRDITLRSLDVLNNVDLIACEDTRVSGKLLSFYGIKKPLVSYNDHASAGKRDKLLEKLLNGESIALISDAGMPLISDPGYKLVRECWEKGVYVTTLPGANAPLSALQLSGLPSDSFSFIGFLPSKTGARKKVLEQWSDTNGALIVFENASRLSSSLQDIHDVLGDRTMALVREITKMYEEVRQGEVSELIAYYEESPKPKGEIVLVIGAQEEREYSEDDIKALLVKALKEASTKEAAADVARITGISKKKLYEQALDLKS